jgi:hypothetical protein
MEAGLQEVQDHLGLGQPLLVDWALVVDHGGQGVELRGEPAERGPAAKGVDEAQEGSEPRLDDDESPAGAEDATGLGKGAGKVLGQVGQVMEAALHDGDVS